MQRQELAELAGEDVARSIFRRAPTEAPALATRAVGRRDEQHVRAFVYEDVLDELSFAASYRQAPSVAILVGAFAVDDRGPFLEVTGFSRFGHLSALDELAEVLGTDLDGVIDEVSAGVEQTEHIVGLFVGAPDSGGRLPVDVARAHLTYFNIPYQIAAVVDPTNDQFGVYARGPGEPFYNSEFWTVRHVQSQ